MTAIAAQALTWYDEHARDLPWRSPDATPWGILVSEVMLQQTPVVRVLPAWLNWLDKWPTPAHLAADTPAEAIRAWNRLGYPRRALRLHACATALVSQHEGQVPDAVDALLALPGIGAYTARAVAAFAFGRREPVVDVNVRRFVARAVTGLADGGAATTPADFALVETLLPAEDAPRVSAAFMELGALVCVARSPRCADCPVVRTCAWRAAGQPAAEGPGRRPQGYAGTDRQVRGLMMALLRDARDPVPLRTLDAVWPDEVQRRRALAGLVEDGLAYEVGAGLYSLPV
ncbi:A/G-specific adenine glycosylase [Longispora fulva]|uniref:Adenine DNA glycosylase n=1 Tax=Longispora fulva TaxID=619741 RepID=A0A8J7KYD0_9ACTN|nr:A/G-specific adenine glycosylase [Longispora fulva]MBG6139202.1 A/G-specific adenine glycosylase [Longispora fulva]